MREIARSLLNGTADAQEGGDSKASYKEEKGTSRILHKRLLSIACYNLMYLSATCVQLMMYITAKTSLFKRSVFLSVA